MGKRILVLIDGFNYYHKLANYQKYQNVCVKWLDYMSLLKSAVESSLKTDTYDMEVIFFSAIAKHRSLESQSRHRTYIKALKTSGIKVILGEFKEKSIYPCRDCKQKRPDEKIIKHEEKHTDVNVAITLLEKAMTNNFDIAYLLSEDNDYVPVVKRVKELFPEKEIIICPPPQKNYSVHSLVSASGETDFYRFRWKQIKHFQFPDEYEGLTNPWKIS
ncbi:NYN domain-containing protein [bacterium]|nr:NYN domain-containing protein [bacterium]